MDELREQFDALTPEQKTQVFMNYVAMKEENMLSHGGCKGCGSHNGECGVCVCSTWVPCG